MANLINAERISMTYGTRTLLDQVSLGLSRGDVIGVVGRNGDGKTTLLRILTGVLEPDAGRVTQTGQVSVGYLHQADDFDATLHGPRHHRRRPSPITSGPPTPRPGRWSSTCSPRSNSTGRCTRSAVASAAGSRWSR